MTLVPAASPLLGWEEPDGDVNTVTSPGNRAADHAAVHHGERNASPAQPRYGLSHVIRAPLTMRRGLQAALRRAPRPGRCPGRRSFGYEAGWRTPASSTRCSRCSRVMGGRSRRGEARPRIPGMWAGAGTTRRRWWALGARTPWSRTRRLRGRGAIKVTTRCLRDRASRTGRSRHPASRLPPPAAFVHAWTAEPGGASVAAAGVAGTATALVSRRRARAPRCTTRIPLISRRARYTRSRRCTPWTGLRPLVKTATV